MAAMSKSAMVRAALRERYPAGLLPYGAQAGIGREFGLARNTVCAIAASLDMQLAGPRHGTISTYTHHGCRCDPCVDAWRRYHRNYRHRGDD